MEDNVILKRENGKVTAETIEKTGAKFFMGPGGALMCDRPIAGITQLLGGQSGVYYGSSYMICESIRVSAAKSIAEFLGGEFVNREDV